MATTVTVTIDGRQYRLRCDDQQKTLSAAAEVERLIRMLREQSTDQSTPTLAILSALNLAERCATLEAQLNDVDKYVSERIHHVRKYLERGIRDAVELAA